MTFDMYVVMVFMLMLLWLVLVKFNECVNFLYGIDNFYVLEVETYIAIRKFECLPDYGGKQFVSKFILFCGTKVSLVEFWYICIHGTNVMPKVRIYKKG